MSHYKSNLRDIEFNLFEVHKVQDLVDHEEWADFDEETFRHLLVEIDRLAREDFANSYVDQDRIELELKDGEVEIQQSVKDSCQGFQRGWLGTSWVARRNGR